MKDKPFVAPPRSRATTAYGLLRAVKRVILEDPKRIRMEWFGYGQKEIRDSPLLKKDIPACGIVGCLAGWVGQLHTGRIFFGREAGVLLGLTDEQYQLFYDYANHGVTAPDGTRLHAKQVAKRLDEFMDANKAQLQAHRLPEAKSLAMVE